MKIVEIFPELLYDKSKLTITFAKGQNKEVARLYCGFKIDPKKDYEIKITPKKNSRSLSANALLWKCLGEIAISLGTDKWDVYLTMLKRYGKYTHIVVKENAVEAVKKQWRETEVIGDITVNGKKAVQMLCYFGSSRYNTKEFSYLLDGVISEMKEMGLETPTSKEMQAALERLEKEQWGASEWLKD